MTQPSQSAGIAVSHGQSTRAPSRESAGQLGTRYGLNRKSVGQRAGGSTRRSVSGASITNRTYVRTPVHGEPNGEPNRSAKPAAPCSSAAVGGAQSPAFLSVRATLAADGRAGVAS